MAITLVHIVGKWNNADGSPATGTVSFEPASSIVDPNNRIVGTTPVVATLDGTGSISTYIYANNDPSVLPVGTSYTVIEEISGATIRSYNLVVPHTTSVIDLSTLAPPTLPNQTGTVSSADLQAEIVRATSAEAALVSQGASLQSQINTNDSHAVHNVNDETVDGVKTFVDPPVVPDRSFSHNAISDFDNQVHSSRLDQLASPNSDLSINSHKVINVADPTNPQDAVTKNYIDGLDIGNVKLVGDQNVSGIKTFASKQLFEGGFVAGKQAWIDVSHPIWGVDMTGRVDSTVGFQAACDACYSNANPSTTTRTATARLYIPPGSILLNGGWKLQSIIGLHIMGAGPQATKLIIGNAVPADTAGTTRALSFNGIAYCTIEGFTVLGNGTEAVTEAIGVYWDNTTGSPTKTNRSTTQNTFRNIGVANIKCAIGMHLGRVGDSNQVDNSTIDHVVLAGQWTPGENTWWQSGLKVGSGTFGNILDHTALHPSVFTWRKNIHMAASQLGMYGGSFANAEDDIYLEGMTSYLKVSGIRSENSMHLMRGIGPTTSATFVSLEDFSWHGGLAATDASQINNIGVTSGTFTLTYGGQTTTPIAYNASASTIDAALSALSSINGTANVTVTGGPANTARVNIILLNGLSNAGMTMDSSLLVGGTPLLSPVNHWIEHALGGNLKITNVRNVGTFATNMIPQIYTNTSKQLTIDIDGLGSGAPLADAFNLSALTTVTARGFVYSDAHGVIVSSIDGSLIINGSLHMAPLGGVDDTVLSRNSAGVWSTTRLHATDGLATKLKAGSFTDADFAGSVTSLAGMGLFGINDTTGQIEYRRANGSWGQIGSITNVTISTYIPLIERSGQLSTGATAGTRIILNGSSPVAGTGATAGLGGFYFDPIDYTIGGHTTNLRIRLTIMTNDVGPGCDMTVAMKPLNSPTGANGTNAGSPGTTVVGSTATVFSASIPADSIAHAETIDFAMPVAGFYVMTLNNSNVTAVNSTVLVKALLSYKVS